MSFSSTALALSPALYLKCDETSNGTATDSSGNAHNGTHTNVTLSQASMLGDGTGTSASYNGTNAVTSVPNASWMDSTSITVVMRGKWGGTADEFIATRWATSTHRPFIFYISAAGKLIAGLNDDAVGSRLVGATTLTAGVTYTVAMRANGTTLQVFLNGVSDGSVNRTGPTQTVAPFEIARAAGAAFSPAKVDEVVYFTTALSDANILALHNAAIAVPYTGTVTRALTISATSAGARGRSGTASPTLTISAASALRLGLSGQATRALTVTAASAGVRGKIGIAAAVLAIAAVSAGTVTSGATGDATPHLTISTASAAALGVHGQASPTLVVGTSSAGTRGKVGAATKALTVIGVSAGVRGRPGTATPGLALSVVADGTVTTGTGSALKLADGTTLINPRFADGTTLIVRGWLDADGTTIHPFT